MAAARGVAATLLPYSISCFVDIEVAGGFEDGGFSGASRPMEIPTRRTTLEIPIAMRFLDRFEPSPIDRFDISEVTSKVCRAGVVWRWLSTEAFRGSPIRSGWNPRVGIPPTCSSLRTFPRRAWQPKDLLLDSKQVAENESDRVLWRFRELARDCAALTWKVPPVTAARPRKPRGGRGVGYSLGLG